MKMPNFAQIVLKFVGRAGNRDEGEHREGK
jgi:hypothetical protein